MEDLFAFLRELGFNGPEVSCISNAQIGTTFRARFVSSKRTLEIDLDKAHKKTPNGATFNINTVPAVDPFESVMSAMYLPLKHRELGNLFAEFERTHTLEEIMELAFPLFADLVRGELRPLLTAEQWHDEYEFYRE